MGFFSTLNKIIQGKPLFEAEEQKGIAKEHVAEQTQVLNNSKKTTPIVQIEHIEVDSDGDRMEVRCHICNESSEHDIELDNTYSIYRIRVMGPIKDIQQLIA